jgi:hypothetical protein
MTGDLDDLARTAADALVSVMVTDSWEAVKRRFAALVGHERRMDVTHTELTAVSGPDRDRAQLAQARVWSTRLRDVLDDDPAAAEGLRSLIAELGTISASITPGSQRAQADRGSQAVNIGGNISGNSGEIYVGVGKVDKRKVNIALAPFLFVMRATKQVLAAHPAVAAASAVVVVVAAAGIGGWGAHWPTAVFGATTPKAAMRAAAKTLPAALPKTLSWTAVQAPLPSDTTPAIMNAGLNGVSCPSAASCTAAGMYQDSSGQEESVAENGSGGSWAPTPLLKAASDTYPDNQVNAVTCPTSGLCMAAGSYLYQNGGPFVGLIDTLSGGSWTPSAVTSVPSDAGRDTNVQINAIACASSATCVAVGYNWYSGNSSEMPTEERLLAETLVNGTWTAADVPLPSDAAQPNTDAELSGVTCLAPGACVAVGTYSGPNGNDEGVISTLANGSWTSVKAPSIGSTAEVSDLYGVACAATGSCVAVGTSTGANGNGGGAIEMLANGTWRPVEAPVPNSANAADFHGVTCIAAGSCIAVGNYGTPATDGEGNGLIDVLSDGAWYPATAPLPADAAKRDRVVRLTGVACTASGDCEIAGGYTAIGNGYDPLIETAVVTKKP